MPTYDIKILRRIGKPSEIVSRNLEQTDEYGVYKYAKVNLGAAKIMSIIDVATGEKLDIKAFSERYKAEAEAKK